MTSEVARLLRLLHDETEQYPEHFVGDQTLHECVHDLCLELTGDSDIDHRGVFRE